MALLPHNCSWGSKRGCISTFPQKRHVASVPRTFGFFPLLSQAVIFTFSSQSLLIATSFHNQTKAERLPKWCESLPDVLPHLSLSYTDPHTVDTEVRTTRNNCCLSFSQPHREWPRYKDEIHKCFKQNIWDAHDQLWMKWLVLPMQIWHLLAC